MVLLAAVLCIPALAVTEAEVEEQVNNAGKESVTGSVLIWFLCALGFLKVSQKIDSIMASLGVNAGRTGGSLLGEAMIAMRAVTMIARGGKGALSSRGSVNGSSGNGSGSSGWFLKGGLAGAASRHVTNSAVKTATTQTSAVNTVQPSPQKSVSGSGPQSGAAAHSNSETREANTSSIQPDNVPASNIPVQDGVIVTGGENAPSISTMDNAPIQTSPPEKGMPPDPTVPDNAVIQMAVPGDSSIPVGSGPVETYQPVSDGIPPDSSSIESGNLPIQEGTIITGDGETIFHAPENSSPDGNGISVETSAPVSDGIPTENSSVESGVPMQDSPPQDGIIITGDNGTTLHVSEGGVQPGADRERVTVGGGERQTVTSRETVSHSAQSASAAERSRTHSQSSVNRSQVVNSVRPSLGGMIFSKSLAAGGNFANNVIGTVARGEVAGSITGDMAVQSLASYLGHTNMIGAAPAQIPYRDVEIGRGRITGTEIMPEHPEGISFTMYNAAQYVKPEDSFQKIQSADGQTWYKQYAVDTVKKTPFQAPEGKIGYTEEIVKRMPKAPQRKERM